MRYQPHDDDPRAFGGLFRIHHTRGVARATALDGGRASPFEVWTGQKLLGFMQGHPCIGARSLAGKAEDTRDAAGSGRAPYEGLLFSSYADMSSVASAIAFIDDLENYYRVSDSIDAVLKTFVAVFPRVDISGQTEFAEHYWAFAQLLCDVSSLTHGWDANASSDPLDDSFELSLAGRAVFTTTLNPHSNRIARRFHYPAWVMNQTRQFDALREAGDFDRWKASIRAKDAAIDPSGQPNPILDDHGAASSAPQLAGSALDPCPLVVPKSMQEVRAAGERLLRRSQQEGASRSITEDLCRRIEALA